jgi:hypothetical protein
LDPGSGFAARLLNGRFTTRLVAEARWRHPFRPCQCRSNNPMAGSASNHPGPRPRPAGGSLRATDLRHQLASELSLTLGYLSLLQDDPRVPPELREWVAEALRGAEGAVVAADQLEAPANERSGDPLLLASRAECGQ